MSIQLTKTLKRTASIAAAAALFHIGGAAAATADFQQQVRQVLAGTIATQSAPRAERSDTMVRRSVDTQEFARQLLLGVPATRATEAVRDVGNSAPQQRARALAPADTQASVQRLLLGVQSFAHGS